MPYLAAWSVRLASMCEDLPNWLDYKLLAMISVDKAVTLKTARCARLHDSLLRAFIYDGPEIQTRDLPDLTPHDGSPEHHSGVTNTRKYFADLNRYRSPSSSITRRSLNTYRAFTDPVPIFTLSRFMKSISG